MPHATDWSIPETRWVVPLELWFINRIIPRPKNPPIRTWAAKTVQQIITVKFFKRDWTSLTPRENPITDLWMTNAPNTCKRTGAWSRSPRERPKRQKKINDVLLKIIVTPSKTACIERAATNKMARMLECASGSKCISLSSLPGICSSGEVGDSGNGSWCSPRSRSTSESPIQFLSRAYTMAWTSFLFYFTRIGAPFLYLFNKQNE